LNFSIRLALHMPRQQLNIPWVEEHTLQAVNQVGTTSQGWEFLSH
jgi:hypothetical protein